MAALVTVAVALGNVGDGSPQGAASEARRSEVKELGATVMPFDLDRTRHVFTELSDGGEQTVTVLDPSDAEQTELVRMHLQEEATRFRAGDFADPAAIHGADMPGLAKLRDGAARIAVTYIPLPDGAALRYTTIEPVLIDGIHSWFRARSTDHG